MAKELNKYFLGLYKLGMLKPLIKFSGALRTKVIKSACWNIGLVPGQLVYLDFLTDSLMHSILPERYFSSKSSIEASYIKLEETFKRCFGYKYVLPIAQGRMAEIILAKIMVRNGMTIPSNMLFVTTRLHQELNGATVIEIPVSQAYDLKSDFPFKGNMDTEKLENTILEYGPSWIPYIYLETCVNASGGHPFSMENLKEINRIGKKYKIPIILDACRILENAYLIKKREAGYSNKSVFEIVREICSLSDGCTMSATKDFFVDSGGFIATNNQELYYQARDIISVFGDGLSIRTKAILNDVLTEAFSKERLVRQRVERVAYLWNKLKDSGLPIVNPSGGHGVFLDANDVCKNLSEELNPEKAFLVYLYIVSGIRGGENIITPQQKKLGLKMIRLAIPACMYSLKDMAYAAKKIKCAWENKNKIKGLKKVYQPPSLSGSFFSEYELIED